MSAEKSTGIDAAAVDAAISKVKARKAAQAGEVPATTESTATGEKPKRQKLTDAEKAAKQAAKDAERAQKKAARDAKKAAKEAEAKKTPHMSKVDRAAAKLAPLNDSAKDLFEQITTNFGRSQISALAEHLAHFNRAKATERSLTMTLGVGDKVRINGGDPKAIGKEGILTKVQRIRCYVAVPGLPKDAYCFTSDVEVLEKAPAPAATEDEATSEETSDAAANG